MTIVLELSPAEFRIIYDAIAERLTQPYKLDETKTEAEALFATLAEIAIADPIFDFTDDALL